MNRVQKKWIISVVFLVTLFIVPATFGKYTTKFNRKIKISARPCEYDVIFDKNEPSGTTALGSMSNQHFVYGTEQNLNVNNYTISGYIFTGWNTKSDGTGSYYSDDQLVNNLTDIEGAEVVLYAQWRDYVASIDGVYYKTLQSAVNAVPNNKETTITLLSNVSESVEIKDKQIINLNLQSYTISNNGSSRVINNKGILTINSGTIRSSAAYSAIDNYSPGIVYMNGGRVIATGDRQAIYNSAGKVFISGDTYLSSSITVEGERGTVHNLNNGTVTITGGTIISTTNQAVYNAGGTLTIGTKDGNADKTTPVIRGETYGIKSVVGFNFYNGISSGKINGIYDLTLVTDKEIDFQLATATQTIEGEKYKSCYLASAKLVTFNPNGGTISESTRYIETGKSIGELPEPTRSGYEFAGWFDDSINEEITSDKIINEDIILTAHWNKIYSASINDVNYDTLQDAIDAVDADNNEVTIKLLTNVTENVTIAANKKIVLDLQSFTLRNSDATAVITNNGSLTINSGKIYTDSATTSAINNNKNAKFYMTGGSIVATGKRQALYNDAGYAVISGDAYLSSSITVDGDRGTVQNLNNGTIIITGGTIISTTRQAIHNASGVITLGIKDQNVMSSPIIQGETYGITTSSTLNIYDGIIKGITSAINNESKIVDTESGYTLNHASETINDKDYSTAYLSATE